MKVAFLVHSFGRFGGREIQTTVLSAELNRRKIFTSIYHSGAPVPAAISKNISQRLRRLPLGVREFRATVRIISELASYDYIVNMGCEPLLSLALLLFHRKRMVLYATSPLEVDWAERITGMDYPKLSRSFEQTIVTFYGRLGKQLIRNRWTYKACKTLAQATERISLRLYTRAFGVSGFAAKEVELRYGLRKGTIRPLYQVVRQDLFEESEKNGDVGIGSYILAVGALVPEKNFELLIKAVSVLAKNVRVMIVGEGPEKERLSHLAMELGVHLEICSTGDPKELAGLYLRSMFIVQPSLYESLSMVPVEAALFQKPTIIANSRFSGDREIVKHRNNGILVEDGDPHLLAKEVKFLLENPAERMRMGSEARSSITPLFSRERRVSEFIEALAHEKER